MPDAPLVFSPEHPYNKNMDIETVDMNQAAVQEQAATQVQADREKEQAAAVDTTIANVQTITDPNLGQNVNLLD